MLGLGAAAAPASAQRASSADTLAAFGTASARPQAFRWARPEGNPWVGADKLQHATMSALVVAGTHALLVQRLGASRRSALPVAIAVGVQVGVTKEVVDGLSRTGSGFSVYDLVWDAAGIGAGVLLARW